MEDPHGQLPPGKAVVDLKIMRDFEPKYVDGMGKVNFIEAWGYDFQGGIYQAIEGDHLPFYHCRGDQAEGRSRYRTVPHPAVQAGQCAQDHRALHRSFCRCEEGHHRAKAL